MGERGKHGAEAVLAINGGPLRTAEQHLQVLKAAAKVMNDPSTIDIIRTQDPSACRSILIQMREAAQDMLLVKKEGGAGTEYSELAESVTNFMSANLGLIERKCEKSSINSSDIGIVKGYLSNNI